MQFIKLKGGIQANWQGAPAQGHLSPIFTPSHLRLELKTPRFWFKTLKVEEGQKVETAQVLAQDPNADNTPLLSPLSGTAHIELDDREKPCAIRIENLGAREPERDWSPPLPDHNSGRDSHDNLRQRFLEGGGWPWIYHWPGDGAPSLQTHPEGIIISGFRTEPFRPDSNVLLREKVGEFALGLELLQKMVGGYEKIFLVLPRYEDEKLGEALRERLRGYAWLSVHYAKRTYPYDHPGVLLQNMGVPVSMEKYYWHLTTQSVLALHRILETKRPFLSQMISVAGPGVKDPGFMRAYPGTPVAEILRGRCPDLENCVVILGGVFTGRMVDPEKDALGIEDDAVTVISRGDYKEMFGWMMPGFDRHTVTRTYVSPFFPLLEKKLTARAWGELRACIQCNYCENVCPVPGLMPYLFHRYQPLGMIDEMEQAGIWNCVECGCCNYVCPSKIDILGKIQEGKAVIKEEMEEMEED